MYVTLSLTHSDFERLNVSSCQWAEHEAEWREQQNPEDPRYLPRFAVLEDGEFVEKEPRYDFKYAYFFQNWSDVIMARSFLTALNMDYQIMSDEGSGDWMIITDYQENFWTRTLAREAQTD